MPSPRARRRRRRARRTSSATCAPGTRVGRVAGGRRPAIRDPRPRAKSAPRDSRPRATRARPSSPPIIPNRRRATTRFFIDRGAHPRLPLSPPHHDLAADESPAHYAQGMRRPRRGSCSRRRWWSGRQSSPRAASTRCSRWATGCCCGSPGPQQLDAADIGKPRPRWDGPFTELARPSPNAYTLALPRSMRYCPTAKLIASNPSLSVSASLTRDRRVRPSVDAPTQPPAARRPPPPPPCLRRSAAACCRCATACRPATQAGGLPLPPTPELASGSCLTGADGAASVLLAWR